MIWILLLILFKGINAHSWLDCLSHSSEVAGAYGYYNDWVYNAANVQGVCDGYPRNYSPRNEVLTNEINTKELLYSEMNNLDTPLCIDQTRDSYNDLFHMLQASPGDEIYFGYTENGHLSKTFEGVDTTIKIYYKPDQQEISTVRDFDSFEIAGEISFDDGNKCGEPTYSDGRLNGRSGKPCLASFIVPDLCPGTYSFMWYWNSKSLGAYYSCFDVEVL